ncbi:MAG: hypothetical protein ACRBCI_04070 [Cellvibrionaceae bacterium]
MSAILKNAAIRILLPPFAGLFFYGSWAFWVNYEHGQMAAFKAACTQGGYSFTITLLLALAIEWLFKVLQSLRFHSLWVAVIACSLLYSSSWGVNALTGTPNIFLTILPGALVSTIYTIIYIVTLNKLKS